MHAQSLIAAALVTTTAVAAEPVPFYTADFVESPSVSLVLRSGAASVDAAYDYDVVIGVNTMAEDGSISYRDPGIHAARVRCGRPAAVSVGGTDYLVGVAEQSFKTADWKADLWRAVCNVPVS